MYCVLTSVPSDVEDRKALENGPKAQKRKFLMVNEKAREKAHDGKIQAL